MILPLSQPRIPRQGHRGHMQRGPHGRGDALLTPCQGHDRHARRAGLLEDTRTLIHRRARGHHIIHQQPTPALDPALMVHSKGSAHVYGPLPGGEPRLRAHVLDPAKTSRSVRNRKLGRQPCPQQGRLVVAAFAFLARMHGNDRDPVKPMPRKVGLHAGAQERSEVRAEMGCAIVFELLNGFAKRAAIAHGRTSEIEPNRASSTERAHIVMTNFTVGRIAASTAKRIQHVFRTGPAIPTEMPVIIDHPRIARGAIARKNQVQQGRPYARKILPAHRIASRYRVNIIMRCITAFLRQDGECIQVFRRRG